MEMDIDIEGVDELNRALRALPELLAVRVQGDGLIAAARVVRDEAKTLVPVKTGSLRDSIRASRRAQTVDTFRGRKRVPGGAAQVRAGGKGARHAWLVEFGTVKTAAHPYLEPALNGNRSRLLRVAAAEMSKAFVKLGTELAAGRATRVTRRLVSE